MEWTWEKFIAEYRRLAKDELPLGDVALWNIIVQENGESPANYVEIKAIDSKDGELHTLELPDDCESCQDLNYIS